MLCVSQRVLQTLLVFYVVRLRGMSERRVVDYIAYRAVVLMMYWPEDCVGLRDQWLDE
jgi:hypothetical protein